MKNKKIGLDLDGVLYPFPEICYNILKDKYNFGYEYKEFWTKARKEKFMDDDIREIAKRSGTYSLGSISQYNLMIIKELIRQGNELFYITARGKKHADVTRAWFKRDHIPMVENLHMGHHWKSHIVKELELDCFVDDRAYAVKNVSKVTLAMRYFATYMTYEQLKESNNYIVSLGELIGMKI